MLVEETNGVSMQLELTEPERRELAQMVRNAHAELNPEIHHTRDPEYLEVLHRRRTLLAVLLQRLEPHVAAAA